MAKFTSALAKETHLTGKKSKSNSAGLAFLEAEAQLEVRGTHVVNPWHSLSTQACKARECEILTFLVHKEVA